MFRTLIYPSPVACDYSFELPQWSYCYINTEHLSLAYIMLCSGVFDVTCLAALLYFVSIFLLILNIKVFSAM